MPPAKDTNIPVTDKNPLKRRRDGSRADGASLSSSTSNPKSKKIVTKDVGDGMKGTLLKHGHNIDRAPLVTHRRQVKLPERYLQNRQPHMANAAAAKAVSSHAKEDSEDMEEQPPPPRKKAKIVASDDEEQQAPSPPKQSHQTTNDVNDNNSAPPRPPPKRSRKTTVEDAPDDDDSAPRKPPPKRSRKTTVEDVPEEDDIESNPARRDPTPEPEETEEEKLVQKSKTWTSGIYGFYKTPYVEYVGEKKRVAHTFQCAFCSVKKHRFQDTGDRNSSSALTKHAKACMGAEQVESALKSGKTPAEVKEMLSGHAKAGNKDIRGMFDGMRKKGVLSFSTTQHTLTQTRAEIVRWVSESCRPFEMVADRGFQVLMKTGRPMYWIPHPTTVSRDVKKALAKTRVRIAKMLQDYPGKIHFATDAWTSKNHGAYVAFTAHLMDGDEPMIILLDFIEVPESHTGNTLAREFVRVLNEFGIADRIGCVTADNASPMDVMVERMARKLGPFLGKKHRIRCFSHSVNLVAKSFLRLFDAAKKKKSRKTDEVTPEDATELPEDNNNDDEWGSLRDAADAIAAGDDILLTEEEQAALNAFLKTVEQEEDEDEELADDDEDISDDMGNKDATDDKDDEDGLIECDEDVVEGSQEAIDLETEAKPIREALIKIRTIAFQIIHSSTLLLPAWKALLRRRQERVRIIPRDVRTRWNSTFDMIHFALQYRDAIDEFTAVAANKLRKWELSGDEWALLQDMHDILQVLKEETLHFSSNDPVIADVIPAIDKIDTLFTTQLVKLHLEDGNERNIAISDAFKTSLFLASQTLNKYYALTDDTAVYRIAMILHPSHKLEYFQDNGWMPSWIDGAQKAVKDIWRDEYQGRTELLPEEQVAKKAATATSMAAKIWEKRKHGRAPTERDELDRYLSSDTEPVDDVIQWWIDKRSSFPRLSRMALDYHTIPATSTVVERVFSRGRRLIDWERNRLSAQSIRALMCVGDWSLKGLVHDDDLAVITKDGAVKPSAAEKNLVDVDLPEGFDHIGLLSGSNDVVMIDVSSDEEM